LRVALHEDLDAGRLLDILNVYEHIYRSQPGTKLKENKVSNVKEALTIGFTGIIADA
jgi:hypothetical protein